MNNQSLSNESTWTETDIDDLWRNINNAPSDTISYWVSVASFLFAVLGLISNLMSVVVLSRLSANSSTFVYLTGLSVSDMITCLSIVMTNIIEETVQNRRSTTLTIFLRYVDIFFGALAAGSRTLSLWVSIAVTMDRWVLICYPIYAKTFCTLNRAKIVTRTLFLIALFYSIPLFFEYQIVRMSTEYRKIDSDNESLLSVDEPFDYSNMFVTKGYSNLARLRLYRWAYMFFNIIFVYTVPTVTIVCFNLQLIRALHRVKSRAKRLGKQSATNGTDHRTQNRSNQSKYSVTLMVITMVLTLLLCRSPTIVLWILWSFELTIKIFFDASTSALVRRFHSIANLIAIINAATNFLPFCVFGQLFRAECLNIYCCRKAKQDPFIQQPRRKHDKSNPTKTDGVVTQQPSTTTDEHERNVHATSSSTKMITLCEPEHLKSPSVISPLINQTNDL